MTPSLTFQVVPTVDGGTALRQISRAELELAPIKAKISELLSLLDANPRSAHPTWFSDDQRLRVARDLVEQALHQLAPDPWGP
jgi:hypothetical protein